MGEEEFERGRVIRLSTVAIRAGRDHGQLIERRRTSPIVTERHRTSPTSSSASLIVTEHRRKSSEWRPSPQLRGTSVRTTTASGGEAQSGAYTTRPQRGVNSPPSAQQPG